MLKLLGIIAAVMLSFLVIIFQTSALGGIYFLKPAPDLFFILVFSLYFSVGERAALPTAFFGGVLFDALALNRLGTTALRILLNLGTFQLARRLVFQSWPWRLSLFYLSTFAERFWRVGFVLSPRLVILSSLDLLILLVSTIFIRFALRHLGPTPFLQLKFRKI